MLCSTLRRSLSLLFSISHVAYCIRVSIGWGGKDRIFVSMQFSSHWIFHSCRNAQCNESLREINICIRSTIYNTSMWDVCVSIICLSDVTRQSCMMVKVMNITLAFFLIHFSNVQYYVHLHVECPAFFLIHFSNIQYYAREVQAMETLI